MKTRSLFAVALLFSVVTARAATRTVTNLDDSGPSSLRDTIAVANSGDTIVFGVTGTIGLASEIQFGKNLTISGPGADQVIIQRGATVAMALFHITSGTITISDLTIKNGNRNGPGGAIYKENGNLTLNNCAVTNNLTQSNGSGGGIYNQGGNLTLNGCLLSNNLALGPYGGGIYSSQGTVTLFGCTFTSNTAGNGAAVAVALGVSSLTVSYCTFTFNTAPPSPLEGSGGAIYASGGGNLTLTVESCIFTKNKALGSAAQPRGDGGAIACGGNESDVTTIIRNSTFNENSADGIGGAIRHFSNNSSGGTPAVMLSVTNCTFSANKATSGGALANRCDGTSTATAQVTSCTFSRNGNAAGNGTTLYNVVTNMGAANLTVRSTILQKATGASATNFTNVGGSIISEGYNIADDAPAAFLNGPADQLNTDPRLDPLGLQYNGGVIPTIAVTDGPAIDKGKNFSGAATDQRGVGYLRTYDHAPYANAVPAGDGTDVGAFEAAPDVLQSGSETYFATTSNDHDDGTCGITDCSLREAINRANTIPGANTISFLVGGTFTLNQTLGPLTITDATTLLGITPGSLIISGGNSTPVFSVSGGPSFIIGLTIRDGRSSAFFPTPVGGAGLLNSGTLTLTACAFVNNTAAAGYGSSSEAGGIAQGGAVHNAAGGALTLERCTFNGNSATGGVGGDGSGDFVPAGPGGAARGAAIFNASGGTLTLTNCTLTNNTATGGAGGNNINSFNLSGGNGGGGEGAGVFNQGTLNIRATTVARNTGMGGQGGLGAGSAPGKKGAPGASRGGVTQNSGSATIRNSIVALNTGPTGPDVTGPFSSEGYNLVGAGDTATGFGATGDQVGTNGSPIDPNLGPLQANGGPTDTLALLDGSRAIDGGRSFGLTTDQRGMSRPVDGANFANAPGGDGSDIGAFEKQDVGPLAVPATLANISTRLRVETGDNVLIGGFIVTGTQAKKVIVRAIGTSLPMADKLTNPTLELHGPNGLIEANDNWVESPNKQAIMDSTIAPSSDLESAIVQILPANNAGYTAIVRGVNGGTGIGLVEAYDLDQTVNSKLANISTRGLVQTGDNVLIAGTIIRGDNPQKVVVRALGPSLQIPGELENPTLELRDQNGGLIEANDNWVDSPNKQAIIDSMIPPPNDLESAIVATLPSHGAGYTAIVRGVNDMTGVALVEIYALQ